MSRGTLASQMGLVQKAASAVQERPPPLPFCLAKAHFHVTSHAPVISLDAYGEINVKQNKPLRVRLAPPTPTAFIRDMLSLLVQNKCQV